MAGEHHQMKTNQTQMNTQGWSTWWSWMDTLNSAISHPAVPLEEPRQQRTLGDWRAAQASVGECKWVIKTYTFILSHFSLHIPFFLFFTGILSQPHPSPEIDSVEETDFFPPPPPPVFIGPDDLPILPPPDEPHPSPPPPQFGRSSTARVSFREPISSSYSVEEDEEEEEVGLEMERKGENEVEQEEDEADGGSGHRLHLRAGMPPQMDLLGNKSW